MWHSHYIWLVVLITSSFVSATRNANQLQEYRNLSTCENENCVNDLSLSLIPFEDWQSYFLSRNETTGSVETLCRESLGQNWQSRERRFKVSKQPGSGHREHNWSATDGKCKMVLRPEFRHIKRFSMKKTFIIRFYHRDPRHWLIWKVTWRNLRTASFSHIQRVASTL